MLEEFEIRALENRIVSRVVDELAKRFAPPAPQQPVLNRMQAAAYVGKSLPGFAAWRARLGVRPCSSGRYARRHLDAAMEREARGVFTPHNRRVA